VVQGEPGVTRQLQWAATVGDSLEAPAGAVQGEREVMRRRALGKFRWSVRPPPSQGKLGVANLRAGPSLEVPPRPIFRPDSRGGLRFLQGSLWVAV
jgi:hypothetical protein